MQRKEYKRLLKKADLVIVISSICIGILSSIPKLFRLHMLLGELVIDISIFTGFTLYVWYFNLKTLPTPSDDHYQISGIYKKFVQTILFGSVVMALFVTIHQLLLPKYPLASMMGMYEFRGLIINITIGLFLYYFYQSHVTGMISAKLETIKMDHLNARFELLKQQVNPHFLFNSLSTLKSMVDAGEKQASEFIDQLSCFYRYSLEDTHPNLTRLRQELELLNSYIYLLKTRYGQGLNVQLMIADTYHETIIPPFTLQLLVENAVKHNTIVVNNPLIVKIYIEEDYLIVQNPVMPRRSVEASAHIGLNNIRERYQNLFKASIEVESSPSYFTIKLPIIHEYNNH
ncbi:hypothetical protein GCM10027566_03390 [Arachidicoccus ginsenosidivorans]|uniref:Histidine kinase n=1 Tax=Arachidicoccus ginsenosidivorans TaxID=496057 RepID=A0A5B8VN31_9BACT|nr:histidine kinase [Arachidicoccus ginsenosidivorans]QEC72491.1 histidine kinase [Arachidicoccus ginsenosidivorans]